MKGGYFLNNGRFFGDSDQVFTFGDLSQNDSCVKESFRAENNEIIFGQTIYNHLLNTLEVARIMPPEDFDPEGNCLRKDVSRLLNKNHLYLSAQINIRFFRNEGKTSCLLSAQEIPRGFYPLNEPGLLIFSHLEMVKVTSHRWSYQPSSDNIWQNIIRKRQETGVSELMIFNHEGFVCESVGGSFGYIQNKQVILPSSRSGGYLCSIRDNILRCIKECGYQYLEFDKIDVNDLTNADEFFLFNAVSGIQKVLGFDDHRYHSKQTAILAAKLSDMARKDREKITD